MLGNLLMLVRSSAARAVRSSTTTETTGVRLLLESSVARVLQSAAAERSYARDRLATRHENTPYPTRTYLVLRGAIVYRTYRIHKNLYI